MSETFLRVAVDAPLKDPLTYLPPPNTDPQKISIGTPVKAPLGKRKVNGVVIGTTTERGEFKLRPVALREDCDQYPGLPDAYLKWIQWLSNYYLYPLGQILSSTFPNLKKDGRSVKKSPIVPDVPAQKRPKLTEEQQACFDKIKNFTDFSTHLLHGVTGSGKTEVYMHLLENALTEGKQGLVLVPEISLTPQLIHRFSARFPDQVAVIHSHLTDREKTNQWWSAVLGKKKILIGARSALFCPMNSIGLIIVDEEHEPSFKQDSKLKYNGRDAAIVMAKTHGCPILLGSATPSLETWKNAQEGKYHYHRMSGRVQDRKMPSVETVDLKDLKTEQKVTSQQKENATDLPSWMSPVFYQELLRNYEDGFQSALFLNRRGTAQMAVCSTCGHTFECPNCAISLTLHGRSHLVCHYCDYSEQLTSHCPSCDSDDVNKIGLGTELVEEDLKKLFPSANVFRADRDEINNRTDLENLIGDMESGKIDILVGTQMIAKGLDFPKLTLVGLVLADIGFNLPDFRATERSFQLLTQVSGRAGRHVAEGGKVFIQTYNPEHPSITYSANLDYKGFADQELNSRKELHYPPYGKLALIKMTSASETKGDDLMDLVSHRSHALKSHNYVYSNIQVLGPCPAPLSKIRNKFRYQMILKSLDQASLLKFCHQFLGDEKWVPSGTKVEIDMDPINML